MLASSSPAVAIVSTKRCMDAVPPRRNYLIIQAASRLSSVYIEVRFKDAATGKGFRARPRSTGSSDLDGSLSQAAGGRHDARTTRFRRLRTRNQQREAAESLVLIGLKRFHAGGVAVVHGGDRSRAGYLEVNEIVSQWTKVSVSILHPDGDVRKIFAIGSDCISIGCQFDSGRRA